ncbi:alpha/beta hydrolase [Aquibium carbonis]|uniref:Alpha/beta hydrolase n=1 Tax=Aquibium carbonis TaxID=2495581 RepID=A0A429YZ25_9HYPH|nr:alpha/beta hydrolase [Aquibium carbonis]RST86712.1 alpha/beta hydrolase [Aquibium carbonis]
MYTSQRSLLFPGAALGKGAPPAAPAWGRSVLIDTPDGETLHALHSPAEDDRPTVLFFLGNADNVDHYRFLSDALARRGVGLLALSYRGYGGSTGRPGEAGLLVDGLAAYDWLAASGQVRVVLLGQSLGSAVAVHVAAERPARGVILVSAFDSALALARSFYPFLPVGPLIRDPFRSDLRIAKAVQPKLFIHGDRDGVIPVRFGEALFERAPEPKTFRLYAGYGHNDLWSSALVEDILAFADQTAGD